MAAIDIDGGVPETTLSSSITSGDTSIPVTDGSGYPDGNGGNFYIVIDRGLSSQEVIECSARSGNTITAATRGDDGSSATSHASGAAVEHVVPASELQAMSTHRNATTGTPHGSAYLTTTTHAAVSHTTDMIGDGEITDAKIDTVAASKLTGTASVDTTGNAATADVADAWSTARDLTFTGDVTGTISGLDGSANESAGLTIAAGAVENSMAGFTWTGYSWTGESAQVEQDGTDIETDGSFRYMELGAFGIIVGKITINENGPGGGGQITLAIPGTGATAGAAFIQGYAAGGPDGASGLVGGNVATDVFNIGLSSANPVVSSQEIDLFAIWVVG